MLHGLIGLSNRYNGQQPWREWSARCEECSRKDLITIGEATPRTVRGTKCRRPAGSASLCAKARNMVLQRPLPQQASRSCPPLVMASVPGAPRHSKSPTAVMLPELLPKPLLAAASPRSSQRQSSQRERESSHAQQRIRPSNRSVQRPILPSELPREREVPHSFQLVRLSRQVMLCCCWISRPRPKRRRPFRLPLRQAVLQPRLPPLSTSRPPPRWSSSSWALACTLGLHTSVSRRRCAPCASAWSENCGSSCS